MGAINGVIASGAGFVILGHGCRQGAHRSGVPLQRTTSVKWTPSLVRGKAIPRIGLPITSMGCNGVTRAN